MTAIQPKDVLLAEHLVVERLAEYCLDSTAYRAALRRNQGVPLDEARDVLWFRQLIAQLRREAQQQNFRYVPRDELAFLVGTLMADDRAALPILGEGKALEEVPVNLGASLNNIERDQDREAFDKKMQVQPDPNRRESRFERRLRLLLDAGMDADGTGELPFRLRQSVRMILAQRDGRTHVHWAQLLNDLGRWNWDGRPAQRAWARSFYNDPRVTAAPIPSDKANESENAREEN